MICPVCEHDQMEGSECEVCGKVLRPPSPEAIGTPALEALELTAFEAAVAPASGPAEAPWLERTLEPPVAASTPEPLDVERASEGPRQQTPHPQQAGGAPCRYCRAAAAPGDVFCPGCGMKLPTYQPAANPEPRPSLCRGCGAILTGSACPACGARAPVEET